MANFLGERFLASVFERNPLSELRRLDLSVTPGTQLTANTARGVLATLPELSVLGVSRWNVSGKELKELASEIRKSNMEVVLV